MERCPYCGKEYHKLGIGFHLKRCKMNPDLEKTQFQKDLEQQEAKYNLNPIKCECCGNDVSFKRFRNKSKYCSEYCAKSVANSNRIISEETKSKIRDSMIKFGNEQKNKKINETILFCKNCGKEIKPYLKKDRQIYYPKFCSRECLNEHRHESCVNGGKNSARIQAESRRSKAEILFCSLCENYFDKVTHNDSIFNGWDADVLIWDKKIAVLWNDKWHYEQITEQHSVKQVQNRDKIKYKEIENAGWTVYVIKDLGKFNEEFVKEQFKIFIDSLEK